MGILPDAESCASGGGAGTCGWAAWRAGRNTSAHHATCEFSRRMACHLRLKRFASFLMDYRHTLAAVRAGLVTDAGAHPWSSARAHLVGVDDGRTPLCSEIDDWESFLRLEGEKSVQVRLHSCQRTGRPCGDAAFISQVESLCGRTPHSQKPGPKGIKNAG